jgi:hypothetical protein
MHVYATPEEMQKALADAESKLDRKEHNTHCDAP